MTGRIGIVALAVVLAPVFSGCVSVKGGKMKLPENAVLLDVRSAGEFASGHIDGAVLLPHDEITARIETVVPVKTTPVFVYCRSGRRSGIAVEAMKALGYTDLVDLGGKDEAEEKLRCR